MSHEALSPRQFTDLYHGTNVEGLKEIEPHHAMSFGAFSTNNPSEAAAYARDKARTNGGKPVVYEVEHEPGDIDIDPHASPLGYGNELSDLDEARDYVDAGGWTNFRHSRLKTVGSMSADEATRKGDRLGWGASFGS